MFSRHALYDQLAIFGVGRQLAKRIGITDYMGVGLSAGRRYVATIPGTAQMYVIFWLGDPRAALQVSWPGNSPMEFLKMGVSPEQLSSLHAIVIYQCQKEVEPMLKRLLAQPSMFEPEAVDDAGGRVRVDTNKSPFEFPTAPAKHNPSKRTQKTQS